jgi:hypothetical protein
VQWPKVSRPKNIDEHGILDLERFGMALRLTWTWYEWDGPERPLVETVPPYNLTDTALFSCLNGGDCLTRRQSEFLALIMAKWQSTN